MHQNDLALVVLWPKAYEALDDVEKTILEDFAILDRVTLSLDTENTSPLLNAMYSVSPVFLKEKADSIGVGQFAIITISDSCPDMTLANTMSGIQLVNKNFLSLKLSLRDLPGTQSQLHVTNNGLEYSKHRGVLTNFACSGKGKLSLVDKNWTSIEQFFEFLDGKTQYVILRGYDAISENESLLLSQEEDIDILALDREQFINVSGAIKKTSLWYDNRYVIYVAGSAVYIDLSVPGDRDLPLNWQLDILNSAVSLGQMHIPDRKNGFFCYLFHVLLHKPHVSDRQLEILLSLYDQFRQAEFFPSDDLNFNKLLKNYLHLNNYRSERPANARTYYNLSLASELGIHKGTSLVTIPFVVSHWKKLLKSYYCHIRRLFRPIKSYAPTKLFK